MLFKINWYYEVGKYFCEAYSNFFYVRKDYLLCKIPLFSYWWEAKMDFLRNKAELTWNSIISSFLSCVLRFWQACWLGSNSGYYMLRNISISQRTSRLEVFWWAEFLILKCVLLSALCGRLEVANSTLSLVHYTEPVGERKICLQLMVAKQGLCYCDSLCSGATRAARDGMIYVWRRSDVRVRRAFFFCSPWSGVFLGTKNIYLSFTLFCKRPFYPEEPSI